MDPNSRYYIYLSVLLLAILGGIRKLNHKDSSYKILIGLLCLTFISELTSYWAAIKIQNNMFVYHFFAPLQLIILGKYFDSINHNKKQKIGFIIGIIGAIIAVVNTIYFQPLKILNSNFLLFEGLVIMGLSLYTFQGILTNEKIDIYKYGHFWMIVIFIFFWSITYTWWALYTVLQEKERFLLLNVTQVLWAVNIITYSAIGFVLIYFSSERKQLANE